MILPMGWVPKHTTCLDCGRHNDSAAHASGEQPKDGDVSICWGCGALSVFASVMPEGVRRCTNEELADLMADPDVRRTIASIATSRTPIEAAKRAGMTPKETS